MTDWLRRIEAAHVEQQAEYHEHFTEKFQHWLDAGKGECWLRRPEISAE